MAYFVGCGREQIVNIEETEVQLENLSSTAENNEDELTDYFKCKDHYTIRILIYGSATQQAIDEINARLSNITQAKLNADVEIMMVGYGTYNTQLNMMLAAGDDLDLFAPLENVGPIYEAGQIQAIGDLLLGRFGSNMLHIIDEKY